MPQMNTPLIPRQVLFGNPDRASVRTSPDGARLSWLAPVNGVLNVWVTPVDDLKAAKPVTQDTYRGIRAYGWAYDGRHLIYLQDKGGDENWRVYAVDLAKGSVRDLTPIDGVRAQISGMSYKHPESIMVGINERDPQYHDLYRIDLATGERTLVLENPEYAGFLLDDDYTVRFAERMTPDGGMELLIRENDTWTPYAKIGMEDSMNTHPYGFDATGQVLYWSDARGRDTAALTEVNLTTGVETLLADDSHADLSDIMRHPTERHVQAAAFTYDRKSWQVLDEAITPHLAYLDTVADGEVEVISRSLDDAIWIVAYLMDNGPVRYYRYETTTRQATFLFTNEADLEGQPLAKMQPVIVPARDGLDLVCYLTEPLDAKAPYPMVLFVHGGPWARDHWGYNPNVQWLANRGYAVLQVNYRASTGFGKAYVNAGNMEWAGKIHDDLVDGVRWAVAKGIADENKVAIMGGSYGGYSTLVGVTFTPDVFACGVDIVGPSNLVTLLETVPPYWAPMLAMFATRVGDHHTEEGRKQLKAASPLTKVDQIRKPLLIGQGANDPRVKQAEADQIVTAMQERNIPVTYVLYPDEGHGFARPENRMSFNAVAEAFLAEHLGGRYEPVGDDFVGSTISVPKGADGVRGLSEAMAALDEN